MINAGTSETRSGSKYFFFVLPGTLTPQPTSNGVWMYGYTNTNRKRDIYIERYSGIKRKKENNHNFIRNYETTVFILINISYHYTTTFALSYNYYPSFMMIDFQFEMLIHRASKYKLHAEKSAQCKNNRHILSLSSARGERTTLTR